MANLQLGAVLQQLRRAAARKQEDELSDSQLVERFAKSRDESAFAVLLRRHGPMVLGVCRGILRQLHDVEDAFQATFLILSQKAGCIRRGESVGAWLHGVAHNVALKAKARAARSAGVPPALPDRTQTNPLDELTVRELRQALHEELRQLPEKYRAPLILCYLEGKTQEEAARQLGWPQRRVKGRLQRGGEQLRRCLKKRGLAPAVTLSTALFVAKDASSAVPAALAGATVQAAMTGSASPALVVLVKTGGAFVSFSKAKMAAVLLLAVSVLTGAGVCFLASPQRQQGQSRPAPRAGEKAAAPRSVKHDETKTVEVHGRVLGPDGKPKAGAKILLLGPLDSAEQQELLLEGGKVQQLAVSAADGRFTAAFSKVKQQMRHYLVAQAENAGIDFFDAADLKSEKPIEFRLVKDHVIRGRIVNTEGKPVAGVRVAVNHLSIYPNNSLDSFLVFWKHRPFNIGERGGDKDIYSGVGPLLATTTDANGRFALHGVGEERLVSLRLSGGGIAADEVWVANRAGFDPKLYNKATLDNIPKGERGINGRWMLHGPDASIVLAPEKVIRGVVTEADTGKARAGVIVRLTRKNGDNQTGGDYLNLKLSAKTDAYGRYEIHGAYKAKTYMVEVGSDNETGYLGRAVWAEDTSGYRPITADIRVRKGVIVTGKMIEKSTGKPIKGFVVATDLSDNPFVEKYSDGNFHSALVWFSMWNTDADGVFRAVTIPGPVLLMGGPLGDKSEYKKRIPDPDYPRYFEKAGEVYRYSGSGSGIVWGNYCKVLQIKPDAAVVKHDIVLERRKVRGVMKIQDAEGRPLSDVISWGDAHWIAGDSCTVYAEETDPPRFLIFYEAKQKLAATLSIMPGEKLPPVVKLKPMGSIKGRLLDADGKLLTGIVVDPNYRDKTARRIDGIIHEARPIESDANGAFTLDSLIPGLPFELTFRRGRRNFERIAKSPEATIQVQTGACRDVGAIKLKPAPEKARE
jgi:RNA polymerase sigma factor (sigma-70 family)